MPDIHLNAANLKEHLRKYFVIYAVVIALCALLTNLLWLTTRPRVPSDKAVLFYLADSALDVTPLNELAPDVLSQLQAEGRDVRDVSFEGLLFADPETDYTGSMLLMTRLATGEGDVFFAGQDAMDALLRAGALLPLDDIVAGGWLAEYGLEPCYAETTDEETGETTSFLAGLRLDPMDRLIELNAFQNRGAYLALPYPGENLEDTLRATEIVFEKLTEAPHAGTDGAE